MSLSLGMSVSANPHQDYGSPINRLKTLSVLVGSKEEQPKEMKQQLRSREEKKRERKSQERQN